MGFDWIWSRPSSAWLRLGRTTLDHREPGEGQRAPSASRTPIESCGGVCNDRLTSTPAVAGQRSTAEFSLQVLWLRMREDQDRF